jgi:hypothetical protein
LIFYNWRAKTKLPPSEVNQKEEQVKRGEKGCIHAPLVEISID